MLLLSQTAAVPAGPTVRALESAQSLFVSLCDRVHATKTEGAAQRKVRQNTAKLRIDAECEDEINRIRK